MSRSCSGFVIPNFTLISICNADCKSYRRYLSDYKSERQKNWVSNQIAIYLIRVKPPSLDKITGLLSVSVVEIVR